MYQALSEGKELLNCEDVANYLGVGQTTVSRWCREGKLRCLKIGKVWRIRRDELEDFLKRNENSANHQEFPNSLEEPSRSS